MTMRKIEDAVAAYVHRHELINSGDSLLLALSGGADSVCMARLLLALRARFGITLCAAHYNHGLRDAESVRDEEFVRAFCEQFDIRLILGQGDVAAVAAKKRRGIEETARALRYAFFAQTASAVCAKKIATGHNTDDNSETILLHLIRGAGLRGLAGIAPKRGNIIRPLLGISRQKILAYLAAVEQDFVTDSTNADTAYRRNALRHEVLPQMQAINPNLNETLLRQAALLRQDASYLDALAAETFAAIASIADGAVQIPVAELLALAPAVSGRVLECAVRAISGQHASYLQIQQLLELLSAENPSGKMNLPNGASARRVYGDLLLERTAANAAPITPQILPESGIIMLSGGQKITTSVNFSKNCKKNPTFLFQKNAICGKITVRSRIAGDFVRLNGRIGTKSLKKLFIEHKIPAAQRDALPVFADDMGVIAVYGLGIAERVCPNLDAPTVAIFVEELDTT